MTWRADLYLSDDDKVCSKLTLKEWGERGPSYEVNRFCGRVDNHAEDVHELKKHLRFAVEQWDKRYDGYSESKIMMNKSVHRMAFIETVTCDLQPKAEGYLRELGFTAIGPFTKLKHPDSKVTQWIMGAPEFLEAIKE